MALIESVFKVCGFTESIDTQMNQPYCYGLITTLADTST